MRTSKFYHKCEEAKNLAKSVDKSRSIEMYYYALEHEFNSSEDDWDDYYSVKTELAKVLNDAEEYNRSN